MLDLILLLLIAQLGDVSFSRREAASAMLRAYGEVAVPALRVAVLNHADPEVRRRAGGLLEDARCVGPCPLPWLDSLDIGYHGRDAIIQNWVSKARDWGWGRVDGWPEYRQATLLWTQYLIDEEDWSRQEVEAVLARMVENERRICKEKGWQIAWLEVK